MDTLVVKLAAWAAALEPNDLPKAVREAAKRCIVDVVGVSLAGSRAHVSETARRIAFQEYPAGSSLVLGAEEKLSPLGAAFCNGISAHCLDFDDTCYHGIVHASAAVWPSVLAAGEMVHAGGEAVLTAFITGVEAEYFLGRFLTDHLYMKGWWNSSVLGVIGAAIAVAKVCAFDENLIRQTIQNAACFSFGTRAVLGTPLKSAAMGSVSSLGIYASILARHGLSGPGDVFESPRGFNRLFNDGQKNEKVLDDLGRKYSLEEPGVAFKLYPVCSAAQAAAEALQNIMIDHGLNKDDVKEVVCQVPPLVAVSLIFPEPDNLTQAQFSMPFALGCILTYGRLGVEQLSRSVWQDQTLRREMRKIKMVETFSYDLSEYDRDQHPEAALVKVETMAGDIIEVFNGAATGMPTRPMSDMDLDGKFMACALTLMPPERSIEVLKRLRTIETVSLINDLFSPL